MTRNGRPEVDAEDYFGNQNKKLALADRRPVIRRASDLVGPGISEAAVQVTDYNNALATYNGYYSSLAGAANAPNVEETFVGYTVMDADLGGVQVLYGMQSRVEFRRRFTRNPMDPSSIVFGAWTFDERIPAHFQSSTPGASVTIPSGSTEALTAPTGSLSPTPGFPASFSVAGAQVRVLRQGIYSGSIRVFCLSPPVSITLSLPTSSGGADTIVSESAHLYTTIPFSFRVDHGAGAVVVSVRQSSGSTSAAVWDSIRITRLGDAI